MERNKKRKIAIIYGNCVSEAYSVILKRFILMNEAFETFYFPVELLRKTPITQEEHGIIKKCDLLLMQKGHLQFPSFFEQLPSGCRILSFPALILGTLWPFYRADPRNKPEPDLGFPFGRYPYGDRKVIALLEKGLTATEVYDKYMKLKITDHIDLDGFHQNCLMAGKELENKCDLKIYNYISENFTKKRLFYTLNHPTAVLIIHQVNQLLDNIFGEEISELERTLIQKYAPVSNLQIPIHPQIIEHFHLEWINPENRYEYNNEFLSFQEYYFKYINFY